MSTTAEDGEGSTPRSEPSSRPSLPRSFHFPARTSKNSHRLTRHIRLPMLYIAAALVNELTYERRYQS
jgi:hypothetical protein